LANYLQNLFAIHSTEYTTRFVTLKNEQYEADINNILNADERKEIDSYNKRGCYIEFTRFLSEPKFAIVKIYKNGHK
jgi:hypothetical protein